MEVDRCKPQTAPNVVLGTSFGYFDPFMIDLATKYPDVQFRHASPAVWSPRTGRPGSEPSAGGLCVLLPV